MAKRHFWYRKIPNSYYCPKFVLHARGTSGFYTLSVADTSSCIFRINYPYHSSHLEPMSAAVNGHRTDTASCIRKGANK